MFIISYSIGEDIMKKQIDKYIDEHFDEMLSILKDLIAIPSYYTEPKEGEPYGEAAAKALNKALAVCEGYGFETRNFDNYIGDVTFGGEPELGILFHLDVVPEGEGWDTPPYELTIKDDRAYGRGTIDDKGPGVASIFALHTIKELGIPLKKGVRLIMGSNEERSGSSELKYYIEKEKMPPQVFTPDAYFPLINTEKGMIHKEYKTSFEEEIKERMILGIHGGNTINVVPGKAMAIVAGFSIEELSKEAEKSVPSIKFSFEKLANGIKIIANGTASHAAFAYEGNNALTALLKLLVSLPFDETESFNTLRSLYNMFPYGDAYGKAIGLVASDGERSGDLTLAFSILDYTPESLSIKLDIRFPIICTCEAIHEHLDKKFEKIGITENMIIKSVPPHNVPEESELVQKLLKVYSEYTGASAKALYCGGGTYVHGLKGVAFGPEFPNRPSHNVHSANEFIGLDELKDITKIYARAILSICG